MNHLKMHSLNKIDENVSKIAQLFPNCVTETKDENGEITHKIDFDMLKQELSTSIVEGREERYQFTWPDKKQAILTANAPINKTLRPCREESVNFDTTENLYIEGDNFEVLKLLQETYLGKIKMIYIDPPYNTGSDLVYEDDFVQDSSSYISNSGQIDVNGNRLVTNTESNGRFHTDWLNMIYPRLKLAKDLLTDNGIIFISIDENESENLQKVCNEIFGENNYVGEIIRKTKSMTADNSAGFNNQHEYLKIYAKDKNSILLHGEPKEFSNYTNPDNDPNGDWCSGDPSAKSGGATTSFPIENPFTKRVDYPPKGRYWAFSETTLKDYIKIGKVKFKQSYGPNERGFIFKRYKKDATSLFDPLHSLLGIDNNYMNQTATVELRGLMGADYFSYPKPVAFIKKLIFGCTNENDIVLDFFSGSSTTAHAVIQQNGEDNLKRKFIMVQIPEICEEDSAAKKDNYNNLCDIAKERIRRAGQQILKQVQSDKEKVTNELFAKDNKLVKTNSGGVQTLCLVA